MGLDLPLHICFWHELDNIIPFLIIGFITGMVLSSKKYLGEKTTCGSSIDYGIWSHSAHIFISSLASSFYFVANGFTNWSDYIGMVFLVLIGSVLIPCTLSDVIVPSIYARFSSCSECKETDEGN